jgi:hypothetical protein
MPVSAKAVLVRLMSAFATFIFRRARPQGEHEEKKEWGYLRMVDVSRY